MKKSILKRTAAALAGVSMLTSAFASVYAAPTMNDISVNINFSDINEENYEWAKPYVINMAKQGYITGYDDNTFRPDNEVTRLECLALFARAMGSKDEANAPILELAHEQYDATLRSYSLSWGQDEIVYMLYKGALKKTDLDTYLSGVEKNMPMKRHEAAIIITKAMGGEAEAVADLGVTLSYSDAAQIPSNAIQYVQYVTDNGIMQGMDDNMFSPQTSVLRSQMAVMLSRTVDKTEYSFIQARITDISKGTRQVTVKNSDGESSIYVYNDGTVVNELGEPSGVDAITPGVQAIITLSGEKLVEIDTISSEPDETITGRYVSSSTTSGIIKVRVTPTGESSSRQFECSKDVSIKFDGSPATIRSFKDGDYIEMEISAGKVVSIDGETKTTSIAGAKVESLDIDNVATLTISHSDKNYDGKTYEIDDNVVVTKNDKASDLRSIYTGDTVTLTFEYGVIKKIAAVAKSADAEGKIQAITISSTPSLTVKIGGEDKVYDITSDVEILIDGKEGQLSDFKVGDTVKITTESNAVKKIVAQSVQDLEGSAVGVVTGVNTSYKVITVQKDNGEIMQFQCPENGKTTTTYITRTGLTKKLANIEAGQTIEVKYNVSNGVYIATLVIILSE